MSDFTAKIILELLSNAKWKVYRPFEYYIDHKDGESVIVPRGFITDLASIPRPLYSFIPPNGRYGKAAVVHDYLYFVNYKRDRKNADKIFLNAMKVLKVPMWKRHLMYRAVRLFGNTAWKGYTTDTSKGVEVGIKENKDG